MVEMDPNLDPNLQEATQWMALVTEKLIECLLLRELAIDGLDCYNVAVCMQE